MFCFIKNKIIESIELDKAIFVDNINLTDIRHRFKYPRSMKTSSVYPLCLNEMAIKLIQLLKTPVFLTTTSVLCMGQQLK